MALAAAWEQDGAKAVGRPGLVLDDAAQGVTCGARRLVLPAQDYALLRVYAEARLAGWPGAGPEGVGPLHRGWILTRDFTSGLRDSARWSRALRRYVELYAALLGPRRAEHRARIRELIVTDVLGTQQFFQRKRTLLNAALAAGGLAPALQLHAVHRKPHRAGLLLPPEAIVILGHH